MAHPVSLYIHQILFCFYQEHLTDPLPALTHSFYGVDDSTLVRTCFYENNVADIDYPDLSFRLNEKLWCLNQKTPRLLPVYHGSPGSHSFSDSGHGFPQPGPVKGF